MINEIKTLWAQAWAEYKTEIAQAWAEYKAEMAALKDNK